MGGTRDTLRHGVEVQGSLVVNRSVSRGVGRTRVLYPAPCGTRQDRSGRRVWAHDQWGLGAPPSVWQQTLVGPRYYVEGMSTHGLALLLASIMTAGDVTALDARHPWPAHRAVVQLDQIHTRSARALLTRFDVAVEAAPDPEVVWRVRGLTRATWRAVADGLFIAHEGGSQAWFEIPLQKRISLTHSMEQLPSGERECIYLVGADWAASSTDRKNFASEAVVGSRVRVSFA